MVATETLPVATGAERRTRSANEIDSHNPPWRRKPLVACHFSGLAAAGKIIAVLDQDFPEASRLHDASPRNCRVHIC